MSPNIVQTRTYNGHRSYPIPVWNGIFEHREKIGPALWVYLWCLDRITKEESGIGFVLGSSPVTAERIAGDLHDCDRTVLRHLKSLAEHKYIRLKRTPHGFAISETQFVVFILNASRRLFSDRFFTSGFRPEFYTKLGVDWVNHNGPGPELMEKGMPNGVKQPVSPLKRVLMRTAPELRAELGNVVNVFDPWARDRGEYYSLKWTPRAGAESDEAFRK